MQWNPDNYAQHARFVSDLGMPVVDLLSPQPGERILDLGCGDGVLSKKLRDLGCDVVAVDASADMIEAASALGLNASVMDGHELGFDNEFDAVFSNAALHWMTEPQRVVDGVWRALKTGARFAGEFGGHGNVAGIVAAISDTLSARGLAAANPWYFPRTGDYKMLLESRGFAVKSIELIPRPTALPGAMVDWLCTFAQPFLAAAPSIDKERLFADVVERLRATHCDANGAWFADYVRLRFFAVKMPNKDLP